MIWLWWACSASLEPSTALASMDAWQIAGAGRDPFPEHRETSAECSPAAVVIEDRTIEVDTGLCPYVVLEQPLMAEVNAGDEVEIVFWHDALAALEPAEGHLALGVDEVWLDLVVQIPSPATAYRETVVVPASASAGEPVVLHLHNHGDNTWNVLRVTRLPR